MHHSPFHLGHEVRAIARTFASVTGSTDDPGISPSNIVIMMPFALCDAYGLPLSAARAMATANAFGAAHFLVQDRWLDGDEDVRPPGARLSDVCLARFAGGFHGLFVPDASFWEHFHRYLGECHASLDWERRVLLTGEGSRAVADDRLEETLASVGRKMSPLKATAAGAALLAGRPDSIGLGERIVEDFHAAYQLADDIEDAAADLERERWSVAAWFLAARSGMASPADAADAGELLLAAARSGALEELVGLICSRYRRAAADAAALGAPMLEAHLRESLVQAERVLGRMARRLTLVERCSGSGVGGSSVSDGAPGQSHLHSFSVDGDAFVYDRASGLFFEADGAAVDVLAWMRSGSSESGLDVLRMDHGIAAVDEAAREVAMLRERGAAERGAAGCVAGAASRFGGGHTPSLAGLTAVALNVAGGCNLSCDYCYLSAGGADDRNGPGGGAGLMSDDVAFRAVDLLFDESFGERELSVVFFGGEPLLNAGLVARTARHARHRAAREARRVSFHMTTNGTLLTPDVASMLAAEKVRVLVSIDGPAEAHDSHRTFRNGAGSHDTVAANVSRLPDALMPGARATVTETSPPLAEIVSHLRKLGFGVVHLSPVSGGPMSVGFADRLIAEYEELARLELEAALAGELPGAGCFIEPVLSLEFGRARLRPCGAGARYVSVANDGRMFLCHRFAGDGRYEVGDVERGLDRFAVGRLLADMARRSGACQDCWAFGLCGGACFHDVAAAPEGDGSAAGPRSQRCRVRLRTLELAMWIHASLPEELRKKMASRARAAARPEREERR